MLLLVTRSAMQARRDSGESANVGLLLNPRNTKEPHGLPWAADNDAFGVFDPVLYVKMLGKIVRHPNCLFVTAPDIVGDARETMHRFAKWAPIITELGLPVAYVLQDGIEGVGVPWDMCQAVFVGGTTEFKYTDRVAHILTEAKRRGKWTHMGRVNTVNRIEYAHSLGTVDSVDGSQFSRWSKVHLGWGARSMDHAQQALGSA